MLYHAYRDVWCLLVSAFSLIIGALLYDFMFVFKLFVIMRYV